MCLAIVLHFDALGFRIVALDVLGSDRHDDEGALLKHAGELAFAVGDGKLLLGLVVAEVDIGETSSLVAIVGALVLVEREVAVLSLIDVETDGASGLLVAILQSGTEGDDGATGHEDRNLLVRRSTDAGLATFGGDATIVEVVPDAAFGEIDVALTCLILIDGTNHERWTEHELIAQVEHLGVVAKVHHEGTQHGVVVEINLARQRIDVRHHAIAELDV